MLTKAPAILAGYVHEKSTEPFEWRLYLDSHIDFDDEEVVFYGYCSSSSKRLQDLLDKIRTDLETYPSLYPILIRYGVMGDKVFCIYDEHDEVEARLKFEK
jgi:hypothetical protein